MSLVETCLDHQVLQGLYLRLKLIHGLVLTLQLKLNKQHSVVRMIVRYEALTAVKPECTGITSQCPECHRACHLLLILGDTALRIA